MVSARTAKSKEVLDKLLSMGAKHVVGVDEVGAGSWAGPLVVASAVCRVDWKHEKVRDSKKIPDPRKREKLVEEVLVPPNVLDCWIIKYEADEFKPGRSLGYLKKLAMSQAIAHALTSFPKAVVVVDGIERPEVSRSVRLLMLPKADDLVPAVSAASLIAKVYRDNLMYQYAKQYPGYGFEDNVGYGTMEHVEGLRKLGVTPIHRRTYRPVQQVLLDGMP